MEGRCTCGSVRYRLLEKPIIVHCCHCSWCQRETGSAFVLNALIESDRLQVTGEVMLIKTPSASGKGQEIARCPTCHVALYSHYAGAGRLAAFVRVGTLDDRTACPPDVHIFAASKQPWLQLTGDVPVFGEYYDMQEVWPPEAQARRAAMIARSKA